MISAISITISSALGSYDNSLFEIRRKDHLLEKRDFNGNRFADYSVPTDREFFVEFSISRSEFS